jgi:hypothetical protein
MLASQGMKQLESLSKAFPLPWAKLSKGMAVWDFSNAKYHETPTGSGVFLCVNPEHTQEEFKHNGPRLYNFQLEEHRSRNNVRNQVLLIRKECGITSPYGYDTGRDQEEDERVSRTLGRYGRDKSLIKMAQSIPAQEDVLDAFEKGVGLAPQQEFGMCKQVALTQMMHFRKSHCFPLS